MKQFKIKPDYYDDFHCAAGACPITCCQEWKIAVDDETKKKWKKQYLCTVQGEAELAGFLRQKDGGTVIGLTPEMKCPFLDENKLCKLVIQLGEEALSETCTLFPRQIHEFEDRTEYSLVACCPEVVDILQRQEQIVFVRQEAATEQETAAEIEAATEQETAAEQEAAAEQETATEQEAAAGQEAAFFELRKLMLDILQDKSYPVAQALQMCFYILLDCYHRAFEQAKSRQNRADRRRGIEPEPAGLVPDLAPYSKEAIAELYDAVAGREADPFASFEERNELFLDLAENYRKEGIYRTFLEEIAQLAEQFSGDAEADGKHTNARREPIDSATMQKFAQELAENENWLRNYLAAEIFASFLLPDSNFEDLVAAMQWIGIEYAVIRHVLLLKYQKNGSLERGDIRDTIVYIARMTGYDGEDVREYLENSFQELIWEWGYFALITDERNEDYYV